MNKEPKMTINRREFLKASAASLAALPALAPGFLKAEPSEPGTKVVLIKTGDRKKGVQEAFRLLDASGIKGNRVFIKPNFNTADPTPGSTHNDTLAQIVLEAKGRGAAGITVGERSGPPDTRQVMEDKGIPQLAGELGFNVINFEDLKEEDWVKFTPSGIHWSEGFYVPKAAVDAEYFISTCCLKTHGSGGVFSMSLKLAVGLTPKRLMRELHAARQGNMRTMIAEINLGYKPKLIILDGVEAFVDGGPSRGKRVQAEVFIAGTDRVAVDATGLAVLKDLGSNPAITDMKIFEQEQIKRAVELGLGISGSDQIELVTPDDSSRLYAAKLKTILAQG